MKLPNFTGPAFIGGVLSTAVGVFVAGYVMNMFRDVDQVNKAIGGYDQ